MCWLSAVLVATAAAVQVCFYELLFHLASQALATYPTQMQPDPLPLQFFLQCIKPADHMCALLNPYAACRVCLVARQLNTTFALYSRLEHRCILCSLKLICVLCLQHRGHLQLTAPCFFCAVRCSTVVSNAALLLQLECALSLQHSCFRSSACCAMRGACMWFTALLLLPCSLHRSCWPMGPVVVHAMRYALRLLPAE
jgi:hypothetical protein